MAKVSWGILSTAKIGLEKVIPAMQSGEHSNVVAIASRNFEGAQKAAQELGIPKAYGSYEELLADDQIQAVYNPLPNHLHVEWTIKSLEAGKHVLCEKPVGMNLQEAVYLWKHARSFSGLKVMEAFMYRHHPQWAVIKKLLAENVIGELRNVHALFTYHNVNPNDIRNQAEIGGGGILDIGCYCVSASRFIFDAEPRRVCGALDLDPNFKTDRLASGILEFEKGTATFTCSTQARHQQRVSIFGAKGDIEIMTPFTPQPDENCRIIYRTDSGTKEITVDACNHYTVQGDLFSQAILNNTDVPTPLDDAVANMKVIDAVFESHGSGLWIKL
jgi:predicted dehydrogenase